MPTASITIDHHLINTVKNAGILGPTVKHNDRSHQFARALLKALGEKLNPRVMFV